MLSPMNMMEGLGGSALLVLLNIVWQCAVVFVIAYGAVKLFRPRSPLTRHLVWLLALAGMAACPLIAATGLLGNGQLVQVPLAIELAPEPPQVAHAATTAPTVVIQNEAPQTETEASQVDHTPTAGVPETFASEVAAETVEPGKDDRLALQTSVGLQGDQPVQAPAVAGQPRSGHPIRRVWPLGVLALWIGGVLVLMVRLFVAQLGVWRLVRRSAPARSPSLLRAFASAKAMVDVRRDVALRLSPELAVPVAAGLFRPCVLFPQRLVEQLSGRDLQAIAVHELTHVKRMDPLVMAIERLVQAVLFFHPAVWFASRALDDAREESCDEAVVRATGRPVSYARCLTSLFEQVRVLSHCRIASVGVAHYRSKLFGRVETLLSGRMLLLRRLPHGVKAAVIAAGCAALVLIGGTTFVQGQGTEETETTESEPGTQAAAPETEDDEGADDDVITAASVEGWQPYRWVNEGGPHSARVNAIALCGGSPDVLYAGTSNGVFRSTDGAASWTATAPLNTAVSRFPVQNLAVDPTDASVVYAGCGSTVYKSTDGGDSWMPLGLDGGRWSEGGGIAIDPKNPSTIYVVQEFSRVLKSTDGGETWELKDDGLHYRNLEHFGADPRCPNILYIACSMRSFYESKDGGVTWSRLRSDNEGEDDAAYPSLGSFATDPDDPMIVSLTLDHSGKQTRYVSRDGGYDWKTGDPAMAGWQLRRYRSDETEQGRIELTIETNVLYLTSDGGDTWRALDVPFDPRRLKALRVGDEEGELLYADIDDGDDTFYFSDDGGESWEFLYSAESDPGMQQTATIEKVRELFLYRIGNVNAGSTWMFRRLVAHPTNPNIVYRPSCLGLEKTEDYGRTWIAVNRGLSGFVASAIVCDPEEAGVVYTSGGAGIFKSTNGAQSWRQVSSMLADSGLAVHPLDPRIVLFGGSEEGRVGISVDGGNTWRLVPEVSSRWLEGFVFDSENADVFYALCGEKIFQTTDRGKTWHPTGGSVPRSYTRRFPTVHQTNADIIYQVSDDRQLVRSTDIGQTWETIKSLEGEASRIPVHVHPADPRMIVVGYDRALHVSRDAGETWQAIEIPGHWWFHSIGMDPTDPDIFVVAAQGILLTLDGGKTFETLHDDDDFAMGVAQIAVSPADGAVYAATEGAGVYRLKLEEPTGGSAKEPTHSE
jgi:photosystem II stability/assembly factor-like uncharacterized protein/beta-lactamase regulating signal transducer with metallopeptidase domain